MRRLRVKPARRPTRSETRAPGHVQVEVNSWQPHRNLLTSGEVVSDWNSDSQRSEDGGSTNCVNALLGSVRFRDLVPLSTGLRPIAVPLSTPVDNYVDSLVADYRHT